MINAEATTEAATSLLALARRTFAAAMILQRDPRIPKWARLAFKLAPFCLAIPGPFDEIMVCAVLAFVCIRHRSAVGEAWGMTA